MDIEINTIPLLKVDHGIPYDTPHEGNTSVLEHDDALKVMTDFTEVVPLTIKRDVTLAQALEKMKEHGVRLLMVVDNQDNIVGIITAYDIQSEKPMQYATESGVNMNDIQADMLMTRIERTPAVDFKVVLRSTVAQVAETMRDLDRPHILVIEVDNGQRVRGIFSSSNISRMLGRPVYQPLHAAHSFADIQHEISDRLTH
jgi:CBS-domain-containing membrane protein